MKRPTSEIGIKLIISCGHVSYWGGGQLHDHETGETFITIQIDL